MVFQALVTALPTIFKGASVIAECKGIAETFTAFTDIVKAGSEWLSSYCEQCGADCGSAFNHVSQKLEAIKGQLADQQKAISQISDMVNDIRYKEGIETIEAAYTTLLKGKHNLQSTLDNLKGSIFWLDTMNSRDLNINKIKAYLDLERERNGSKPTASVLDHIYRCSKPVEDLASYVLTVKAEYLIIVSLFYSNMEDHQRVAQEWTDFIRDAIEIIKHVGLADVYEGDTVNELGQTGKGMILSMSHLYPRNLDAFDRRKGKTPGYGCCTSPWPCKCSEHPRDVGFHEGDTVKEFAQGKGTMCYNDRDKYEGEWMNGLEHGFGTMYYKSGGRWKGMYTGDWVRGKRSGNGRFTAESGLQYDGEWLNDMNNGKGRMTYPRGGVDEGVYKDGRLWMGTITRKDGVVMPVKAGETSSFVHWTFPQGFGSGSVLDPDDP
jgi:hypothetical protein